MIKLFTKKNKAPRQLTPRAEAMAGTIANRLMHLQRGAAAWLDRKINHRPSRQKMALLIAGIAGGICWCLYLVISGLMR